MVALSETAEGLSQYSLRRGEFEMILDAMFPIEEDATLELITKEDPEAQEVLNHSCSHLLASAVKKLYPQACFGVGPAIEEGFYYDINPGNNVKITEEDLVKIEKEMKHIAASDVEFKRIEVSKKQALELFKKDKYKVEIISELPETETITCYQHAEFIDLCRGPHVTSTKWLKFCKLLAISGAYWRGDSKTNNCKNLWYLFLFGRRIK